MRRTDKQTCVWLCEWVNTKQNWVKGNLCWTQGDMKVEIVNDKRKKDHVCVSYACARDDGWVDWMDDDNGYQKGQGMCYCTSSLEVNLPSFERETQRFEL